MEAYINTTKPCRCLAFRKMQTKNLKGFTFYNINISCSLVM